LFSKGRYHLNGYREDIGTVAAEAFAVVEENAEESSTGGGQR
jgi:hypothetical protein